MQTIVDHAIVLRRTNYGEADRIITLLTENSGKITVLVKGVRKPKSKLAGGIEPFCVSEISYIRGKSDIYTLTGAKIVHHYPGLTVHLDKLTKASEALRVVDKHIEDNSASEYYALSKQYIHHLNTSDNLSVLEVWWHVQLMMLTGHDINLESEIDGSTFSETGRYLFDYDSAGFFSHSEGLFRPDHIKLLKLCCSNAPNILGRIKNCVEISGDILPTVKTFVKLQIG